MGDYADYEIEKILDWEDASHEDDEFDDGSYRPKSIKSKTCKYCGKTGLFWDQLETGQWVLHEYVSEQNGEYGYEDLEPHICPHFNPYVKK